MLIETATTPETAAIWLESSGHSPKNSVKVQENVTENLRERLTQIQSEITRIPVLAAMHGTRREIKTSTKNGRDYRYAYQVSNGKAKSLGKIGGARDRDLQLSIRKRDLLIEADAIAMLLRQVEEMMDRLEAKVKGLTPERQKRSGSRHRGVAA